MMFRFWVWIVASWAVTIGGRPPWLTAPRTPADDLPGRSRRWSAWVGSVNDGDWAGAAGAPPAGRGRDRAP